MDAAIGHDDLFRAHAAVDQAIEHGPAGEDAGAAEREFLDRDASLRDLLG